MRTKKFIGTLVPPSDSIQRLDLERLDRLDLQSERGELHGVQEVDIDLRKCDAVIVERRAQEDARHERVRFLVAQRIADAALREEELVTAVNHDHRVGLREFKNA